MTGQRITMVLTVAMTTLAVGAAPALAQTGLYALTEEEIPYVKKVWKFQNGALTGSFPVVPATDRHGPIIVDTGTIRSVQFGVKPSLPGSEYTYAGVPGASLTLFPPPTGSGFDAAFDGTSTYIVSQGDVFKYGASFSGPGQFMFTLPSNFVTEGITYDTVTNTIWTSDYGGGRVRQWSWTGVEQFSFPVIDTNGVKSSNNTALAYDAAGNGGLGSFWMNAHLVNTLGFGLGELWEFDRTGTFLQKIHARQTNPSAPASQYLGGEISPAPNTPACEPLPDGSACTQSCPTPGAECRPSKVTCPEPGICIITACDCVAGISCHVEVGSTDPPQPTCVGACPEDTGLCHLESESGGVYECTCPKCEPNLTGTACQGPCPTPGAECWPSEVICSGDVCTITMCDCSVGDPPCHVELGSTDPPHPTCVGTCSGTAACLEFFIDMDGDGVDDRFSCTCEGAPPPCAESDPCDDGLLCNGCETSEAVAGVCQPGHPPSCPANQHCDEDTDSCVVAVPTASEWGLILLGAFLMASSVIAFGLRKSFRRPRAESKSDEPG